MTQGAFEGQERDIMIPKKIHYCWFGRGEKPKLAKRCIDSWKKYCPNYEIIEWNEENFDVYQNGYTKMCYEQKRWAFLSDYVRLVIVHEHGGLYFDTDVELLKSPDFLLPNESFWGFETDSENATVASGLGFGSVAGGSAVESLISEYDELLDGNHGVRMCPELNTLGLVKLGLMRNGLFQRYSWGVVYPKDYFNPYENNTGRLKRTKDTVSIHWYMGSCLSTSAKLRSAITKPLHRIFGDDCFAWLKRK